VADEGARCAAEEVRRCREACVDLARQRVQRGASTEAEEAAVRALAQADVWLVTEEIGRTSEDRDRSIF
jgi:hypothetical protein